MTYGTDLCIFSKMSESPVERRLGNTHNQTNKKARDMAETKEPIGVCIMCGSSDLCECEWGHFVSVTQQGWERREVARRIRRERRRAAEEAEERVEVEE